MSIFKLVNTTDTDILFNSNSDWTIKSTGEKFDLVSDAGLSYEDLIGSLGGEHYDEILGYLVSGDCYMHDGERRVRHWDASYILKYGHPTAADEPWSMSPQTSFVLTEPGGWMDMGTSPIWTVTATQGKELQILSSTTICSMDMSFPLDVCAYFRIKVASGALTVYEKLYKSIKDLTLGVSRVDIIPQIGDPNNSGSNSRLLARTSYPDQSFMSLKSSFAMSLEIGLEMVNGDPIDVTDMNLMSSFHGNLLIFLEGRSRNEY